ncbi:MAG TPA: hypothetical protein PKX83_08030, partial [Bacteroidales bacterium]|nr:hypothetical protein [Bacteroidales bacterium]
EIHCLDLGFGVKRCGACILHGTANVIQAVRYKPDRAGRISAHYSELTQHSLLLPVLPHGLHNLTDIHTDTYGFAGKAKDKKARFP